MSSCAGVQAGRNSSSQVRGNQITIENGLENAYVFSCQLIIFTFIGRPSSHSPLRKGRKDSAANLKAVSGDNKILIDRGHVVLMLMPTAMLIIKCCYDLTFYLFTAQTGKVGGHFGQRWKKLKKTKETTKLFRKIDIYVCFVQSTSVCLNIDVQTKWYKICKGATCYVVA